MDFYFSHTLLTELDSIRWLLLVINAILHVIFAGAVAKDAGLLQKRGIRPHLVSGMTWSFATLIGGVYVAAIYWVLHHIKLNSANK